MLAAAAMHCGARPACAEGRKGSRPACRRRCRAAPHAQHTDRGIRCRASPAGKRVRAKSGPLPPPQGHPGRGLPGNGQVGAVPHRPARQQSAADALDALRLQHGAVLVPGPRIHGKHTVGIGGRGNDRHRTANRRQRSAPDRWPRPDGPEESAPQNDRTRPAPPRQGQPPCSGSGAQWPAPQCPQPPQKSGHPHGANCSGRPIGKAGPAMAAAGHAAGQGTASFCASASPFAVKAR